MKNKAEQKQKSDVALREEAILKFWEENKIFEKSLEKRKDSPLYSFYDGPPFATGTPHYGHIVASTMKDVVPRYWAMRGYYVERKWGWDCHGLPIENIAEKELGITHKKEIIKMGVEKFNEFCRTKVLKYVDEWKVVIKRLGRWADMEHSYKTMDLDFMESVWWVFKELWDRGLVYEGYRSMHICTRCETTLSQTEVAEGYKMIKDLSATAKFKVKSRLGTGIVVANEKGEILLGKRIKTGQWTLPGGKVEKGETYEETIVRETKEETGFDIEIVKTLGLAESILNGAYWRYQNFVGRVKGGELKDEKGKIESWKWVASDKLPDNIYEPSGKTLKLFLADKEGKVSDVLVQENDATYFLAWTTTPWTLIGNVALAINENIKYAMVKTENDFYILAKDRIETVLKDKKYEILSDIKGKDLIGLEYEPLFDYYLHKGLWNEENGWKIYAGDFVTTEEGTGIVHIAPAFGEDDMKLGEKYKLPFIQHVGMDGIIKKEAGEFAGLSVKPMGDPSTPSMNSGQASSHSSLSLRAHPSESKTGQAHQKIDIEIIKYLAHNNYLFAKEKYEHSYPHCWRCDTPLINYATSSWFVDVLKVKVRALGLAKEINWSPEYIKEGRFGKWLEGARDWSISRQRFWASVIPIWKCSGFAETKNQKPKTKTADQNIKICDNVKVVGSVRELEELSGEKITDLHKHVVDKIMFKCEKCGGKMRRVPDVLDTWFDSGSMPYAQMHYPFENKEKFDKGFPADFIAEGVDQTRAWFYYLHLIATAIKDKPAFKNVIVNGIVLAEDGKKMSKRLKNYPDPTLMFDKYGADALRFYLLSSPVVSAETINFKEADVEELSRGMFRMLWNSYLFFQAYATKVESRKLKVESKNLLDRWIISEMNILIKEINEGMEHYELVKTVRAFPKFIDNFSNWYIRRSRDRFAKPENDPDRINAEETMHNVLVTLAKLLAPFTPFVAEEIYKNLTGEESVHFADYPKVDEKLIDKELNEQMGLVRQIVTLGLAARAKAKTKVRQPIASLKIKNQKSKIKIKEELLDLVKDELNIKEILFIDELKEDVGWILETDGKITIALDTKITDELKEEGIVRDVARHIQTMRKDLSLTKENLIEVYAGKNESAAKILANAKWEKYIKEKTITKNIADYKAGEKYDMEKDLEIEGEKIKFAIKKIK